MSIGMKRGKVYLEKHQIEWERNAEKTIHIIKFILQNDVEDIQHIGSTSIKTIPAKPIIDIAVAVRDYDTILLKKDELEKENIIFRFDERPRELLFVMGDFENDTRTHHIHVVLHNSEEWRNYVNFRDYLNTHNDVAERYAEVKKILAEKYPDDRIAYTQGKNNIISEILSEAKKWKIFKMKKYDYITLRERPEIKDKAAKWFSSKWGVPEEAYLECMDAYLNGETEYGWYLCLDGDKIIGGMGVIENDFHDRKDLFPNVCAVYTEEEYRCQGIAGNLLNMVVDDMKSKGITPIYLVTDHTGFYERYGWEFLCMVQGDGEPDMTRMYIHR